MYYLGNNDQKGVGDGCAHVCGIPKRFLSAFDWICRHGLLQMQRTSGAHVCGYCHAHWSPFPYTLLLTTVGAQMGKLQSPYNILCSVTILSLICMVISWSLFKG